MRATRTKFHSALSSAFSSMILIAGLGIASTTAHAAVRVVVVSGQSGYPGYSENYAAPYPGPGYNWTPAYYAYGQYYPGRWVADRGYRDHEFREHEYREHEYREHGYREHRDWDRDDHRDRDRDNRDRDDRHGRDWDDRR